MVERKWAAFGVVTVAVLMSTLDGSMVNIALPNIMGDFHAPLTEVEWVVALYLLTITSTLLAFGRLADIRGIMPVNTSGLALFTVASALCGISRSSTQLIVFRGLQGMGAAMIMACGPAIIVSAFPERERGRAMGLMGTAVAVGLTAGPGLGGLIISKFSWRAIFFVNIPIGALGATISYRVLRGQKVHGGDRRFDWAGGLLAGATLACLLVGIEKGGNEGWGHAPPLVLLASAGVFAWLFLRQEYAHDAPLVDLGLFRSRIFRHGVAGAVILFICHFTSFFLVPFHLVKVMGLSMAKVGLIMTAAPLVHMGVAPLSGWLYDKIGSRIPTTLGMCISGTALFLLSTAGRGPTPAVMALYLGLLGLGAAMFQPPNTTAVMNSVPKDRLGTASSIVAAARNLGMVLGVSLAATLFSVGYHMVEKTGGLHDFTLEKMPAFISGWRTAFLVAVGVAAVGAAVSATRGRG